MSELSGARVAVIGGGLAGIAAALDCRRAGAEVILAEVRPRLGGAAYSVDRDGLTVDNGQHVFLHCCSAYRSLLRELGSEGRVRLQRRLEIPVLRPGGRPLLLRRAGLPPPAHLAGALLRFNAIPLSQRLRAAFAMRALGRLRTADPAVDRRALGSFLEEHGQSEQTIAALWDLIALPTLNVRAPEASLALGAFVFQKGLMESMEGGDVGFHERPLGETIGEPALRRLHREGVDVRLRWRAERVRPDERAGFEVHGTSGGRDEQIDCDAVIVALPHLRAAELLPEQMAPLAAQVRQIGVSPIVNLHVVYDRRVLDMPFAASIESPVQYLFDRTEAGGAPSGTQYVAISLSGADREMASSVDELRSRYLPAIADLLPPARGARVERFMVTREHAATFRAAPGVGELRPEQRTDLPGFALAGAWTATGWPATLESAVLSGHAAAAAVLQDLGAPMPAHETG